MDNEPSCNSTKDSSLPEPPEEARAVESYLQPAAVDRPVVEEEAVVVARVPFHPVVTEAIHRVVAVEVAARAQPALVVVGVEEEGGKNQ